MISNVFAVEPNLAKSAEANTAKQMAFVCRAEGHKPQSIVEPSRREGRPMATVEKLVLSALTERLSIAGLEAKVPVARGKIKSAVTNLVRAGRVDRQEPSHGTRYVTYARVK